MHTPSKALDAAATDRAVTSARSLVALALAVTAVWGFNFVVIKVGTDGVPPLFLAALRFTFVLPALFFVRRPRAGWLLIAGYGLFLGVGEFGLLFTAIKLGAPAGVSSLILQSQAFFTATLAALWLGQPLRTTSLLGMAVAGSGLALIGASGYRAGAWGCDFGLVLGMLLGAAVMWAIANVLAQRIGKVGALSLMVWSSLASPLPLFGLSLLFEGPTAIHAALVSFSWLSAAAVGYLVVLSTLFGYGVWNDLIVKHGAGQVAPFSMLVPIFGLASGSIFLHEAFTIWHALGALLVLAGLSLHAFGSRPKTSREVGAKMPHRR